MILKKSLLHWEVVAAAAAFFVTLLAYVYEFGFVAFYQARAEYVQIVSFFWLVYYPVLVIILYGASIMLGDLVRKWFVRISPVQICRIVLCALAVAVVVYSVGTYLLSRYPWPADYFRWMLSLVLPLLAPMIVFGLLGTTMKG